MIYRLVRMSFVPQRVNEFIEIFKQSREKIKNFPGCISLVLFQDLKDKNVMYTWSLWESEAALEEYKKSELFQVTWNKTKVLFNAPPAAYSLVVMEEQI
ncbi:MAG: antibiotic biosynthesis monooxygenase family protein [Bacteroidia bacterium]|nr:antibiotic biosynthesis monooxygenase [Bacteroidia bacterium]MDW8159496.1 antibiotic biosynthesis monooxygenase family protein [Bacteroidia bacterium]